MAQVKEVEGGLHVAVRELAEGGKAIRAIEKAVARHLGVAPSRVSVVSGFTSRTKVVAVT